MLRRLSGQEGAVSVYLIIIIVPIILLVMLLIDYARMKSSELEAEQAVRSGIRSVLSAYNPVLAHWGLFGLGVDAEKAQMIFQDVIDKNLAVAPSKRENTFVFSDPHVEPGSTHIIPMYMLSNHTIFKSQVLEEMKYKAPIEFALEITDKFKGSQAIPLMKEGAAFADHAQQFEKLLDKREDALDEAWKSAIEMHDAVNGWYGKYEAKIRILSELAGKIGNETAETITARLNDPEEAEQERMRQILSWIGEYVSILAQTKIEAQADYGDMTEFQRKIDESIGFAGKANADLKAEIGRLNKGSDQSGLSANGVFEHIRIYDDTYFASFQTGVGSVAALFAGFRSDMETIHLYNGANYVKATASNEAYFTRNNTFYGQQQAIEAVRQKRNEERNGAKKVKSKEIEGIFELTKSVTGNCGDGDAYSTFYDRLEGGNEEGGSNAEPLKLKYMEINQQIEDETKIGADFELERAEETTSKSMNLLGSIGNLLEGARNELYLNEYALTKFNYRTFGLEKGRDGQFKKERSLSNPSAHTLHNQEAEYLLYGFSSCQANLTTAYAEMFGIRFAIRTLEQLSEPHNELLNVGSPLLVLLTAAAQGAVKAYEDMAALVQGDAVEISAKLTSSVFKLTYKDYLRLFMLLHSNDIKLMSRMQALIELNTGINLAQTPTYVEGNIAVSSSLWFSSSIMKVLQLGGNSRCTVIGNQCSYIKTAASSY